MNIAVFSDIHGNYQALIAIINDIKRNKMDDIIFLGDAISLGPNSKECLNLLIKNDVKYILGNHELYYIKGHSIDRDMDYNEVKHHLWVNSCLGEKYESILENKKLSFDLNINDNKFSFVHFFNHNEIYPFYHLDIFKDNSYKKILDSVDGDYVFYGHRHDESYYEINNKKYYGIGSSGCTKDNKTYYYIISIDDLNNVEIKKKIIHYNRRKFETIVNNTEFPDKRTISNMFFGIK